MTLASRRCHSPNILALGPAAHGALAPRAVTRGPGGGVSVRSNALARTGPAGPKVQSGGGDQCEWSWTAAGKGQSVWEWLWL